MTGPAGCPAHQSTGVSTPPATGRTYDSYLDLRSLPAVRPVTPVPAEAAFITTHQTMEQWFRQQLHDLRAARAHLLAGRLADAVRELARCQVVTTLLTDHLRAMPRLVTPAEFGQFREMLEGGSGAQSVRFRQIETLSGLPGRQGGRDTDGQPSLWEAFVAACRRVTGPDTPADTAVLSALLAGDSDMAGVADALLAHDLAWAAWRAQHALMAAEMIGDVPGTGGTAGVAYLARRAELRFYPDLWELWAQAGTEAAPRRAAGVAR